MLLCSATWNTSFAFLARCSPQYKSIILPYVARQRNYPSVNRESSVNLVRGLSWIEVRWHLTAACILIQSSFHSSSLRTLREYEKSVNLIPEIVPVYKRYLLISQGYTSFFYAWVMFLPLKSFIKLFTWKRPHMSCASDIHHYRWCSRQYGRYGYFRSLQIVPSALQVILRGHFLSKTSTPHRKSGETLVGHQLSISSICKLVSSQVALMN